MKTTQSTATDNRARINTRSSRLAGITVVFSGEIDDVEREEAQAFARNHGAAIRKSVTSRTDYLVTGREPGWRKLERAAEMDVERLTWQQFVSLTIPTHAAR